MKPLFVLFAFLLILQVPVRSQTIENIDWSLKDKQIEIVYDLNSNQDQAYQVKVFVSLDGGVSFRKNPLRYVTGDAGNNIVPGKQKKIVWDVGREMPGFTEGVAVFDIRAIPVSNKKEIFIGYKGSLTAPLGLNAGISGKPGFYISARFNSNIFLKPSYSVQDEYSDPPAGWSIIPGKAERQRLSVTAGLQFSLTKDIYVQGGLGLSKYSNLWKAKNNSLTDDTKWVKMEDNSFLSYEAEVSGIYRIKNFYISAGIASYHIKYTDLTFGIGYIFK
jgi:hypothetical protein